jgi:Protein of unknown function (DUF3106)
MTRQSKAPVQSRQTRAAKMLKLLAILAVACFAGLTGAAALSSVEHHLILPNRNLALQAAANPQKSPAQKSRSNRPPQRMGDWLQSHKNLPLDQQEKALETDPTFKKLPADRQAALRERLRKFNSLPPEQRDLALKRMNFWASLTREQRQQLRDANQKLQGLPQDRRVAIHKALRHLRQMDPQHRQQVMQSDRFKSSFSDQEQGILKQLASINPPENGPSPQPSSPAAQSPKP